MTLIAEPETPIEPPRRRGPSLLDRGRGAVRSGRDGADRMLTSKAPALRIGRPLLAAFVFFVVISAAYNPSPTLFINGLSIGSLYGIIAVGIILIYRTNRIVNF